MNRIQVWATIDPKLIPSGIAMLLELSGSIPETLKIQSQFDVERNERIWRVDMETTE